MVKKTIVVFTLFSVLFFVCLAGFFSFRVLTVRADNKTAAERSYRIIQGELSVLHKLGLDVDTETLRDRFSELNKRHPPLRALTVYSKTTGIYFLKSDQEGLFSDSTLSCPEGAYEPAYTIGPASFLLLRSVLPFPVNGDKEVYVDALYEILGRADIYGPLRLCFILLAVFLVAAAFLLMFMKSPAGGAEKKTVPVPKPAPVPYEKTASTEEHRIPVPETVSPGNTSPQACPPSGLYSPDSGLVWQSFLQERLNNELKRSASFDQDMVLGVLLLSNQGENLKLKALGSLVLERFPFSDLVFEYRNRGIAVILPNTDIDQGIGEFESLLTDITEIAGAASRVAIGLSSRNGRLLDAKRLIKEADRALEKAAAENKSSLIAFRTDPSKYREYIASRV